MKKMLFSVIFLIVLVAVVFAGCMSFKEEIIPENTTGENLSVEEYDTLVAQAMDIPVTDEAGEAVTNEAGEELTTRIYVASEEVAVTDEAGEAVTNAAGQPETTKVYKDASTGKEVKGEVYTTQVFVDKEGNVKEEKPTQKGNTEPSKKPEEEKTTGKQNDSGEKISEQPSSEAPSQSSHPETPSNVSEFEYLKSGKFYLKGVMTDASGTSSPLEMAVTPDSIYMLSNFEGANMGMLVSGKKTYMIYEDKQAYLELSDSVLKYMGMSTDEMLSSNDLNYSQYSLEQADQKLTEELNGRSCTVYVFNSDGGSVRFYMDGNKLQRFATFNQSGVADTVNDVEFITGDVPADKSAPPAGYKSYSGITGMFSFMGLLSDLMT